MVMVDRMHPLIQPLWTFSLIPGAIKCTVLVISGPMGQGSLPASLRHASIERTQRTRPTRHRPRTERRDKSGGIAVLRNSRPSTAARSPLPDGLRSSHGNPIPSPEASGSSPDSLVLPTIIIIVVVVVVIIIIVFVASMSLSGA
ncbi:hypothetical protein CGRA01v4_02233 [Colletotrichum graminicola]|nr:hypothetical protein CGRA01v4_02233 [Colletotrichum graminicola]